MSRIFQRSSGAILVLSFAMMLAPVFAVETAEYAEQSKLRDQAGQLDSAADNGDEPRVKKYADKMKDLLSSYRFDPANNKFREVVDIVVKQGDKGRVLESLLAQDIPGWLLIHHFQEGLRHYEWNFDSNRGDEAKQHRISGAIEQLVRSRHLDVTDRAVSFISVDQSQVAAV